MSLSSAVSGRACECLWSQSTRHQGKQRNWWMIGGISCLNSKLRLAPISESHSYTCPWLEWSRVVLLFKFLIFARGLICAGVRGASGIIAAFLCPSRTIHPRILRRAPCLLALLTLSIGICARSRGCRCRSRGIPACCGCQGRHFRYLLPCKRRNSTRCLQAIPLYSKWNCAKNAACPCLKLVSGAAIGIDSLAFASLKGLIVLIFHGFSWWFVKVRSFAFPISWNRPWAEGWSVGRGRWC